VIEGGCSILQYADDTILLIKDDVECARNLKLLLYTFESMSGLKINFKKSEVLLIQEDDEKMLFYANLFDCQTGSWPSNIEGMEKPIRAFLWASYRGKRRYHLVKWKLICTPRSKGGLGIKNLHRFNISLMCKWWWKLEHDTGPWQDFMWKKYLINSCVFSVKHKAHDSALWTDMLKVKDIYLSGRSMRVNNGERTHFWGDAWCGSTPLKDKYHLLYNLCNEVDINVAAAAARNWFFTYRRWLSAELLVQDGEMRDKLSRVVLTQEVDVPVWDWTKNGQFTIKSVYKDLSKAGIDRSFKHLWKAKIPLKIKVWLWLISHNAIATKDTMLERGWTGNPFCQFCRQKESIFHLFFSCPAAKFVWSCVAKSIGANTRPGNFS
jgi:hypothetical protein